MWIMCGLTALINLSRPRELRLSIRLLRSNRSIERQPVQYKYKLMNNLRTGTRGRMTPTRRIISESRSRHHIMRSWGLLVILSWLHHSRAGDLTFCHVWTPPDSLEKKKKKKLHQIGWLGSYVYQTKKSWPDNGLAGTSHACAVLHVEPPHFFNHADLWIWPTHNYYICCVCTEICSCFKYRAKYFSLYNTSIVWSFI